MKRLIIRSAREVDFPSILEVHQNSIREVASKDHSEDQISSWGDHLSVEGYLKAQENGEEYFVAQEENVILGFSSIKKDTVMAVYVSKRGVGRGVGRALYQVLEEIAIIRNIHKLTLTSSLTARSFYAKLGFIELEEIAHTFKAGATVRAFKMEKGLQQPIIKSTS